MLVIDLDQVIVEVNRRILEDCFGLDQYDLAQAVLILYWNLIVIADRGEVPKGSAEIFFRKVKFWKEDGQEEAPPVFVGIILLKNVRKYTFKCPELAMYF